MCIRKIQLLSLLTVFVALGYAADASAHQIFTFRFTPSALNVTSYGLHRIEIEVDPQFWYTGFVMDLDRSRLPSNTHALVLPPVGFFFDARQTATASLLVIVLPGAPNGSYHQLLDVTQIIPPYPTDRHLFSGPTININITKDQ